MQAQTSSCHSCMGAGEAPSDNGPIDCPDCGGAGFLPSRATLVDWRGRDIERAVANGNTISEADVRFLVGELRNARQALTEIIALAHDSVDPDAIAQRIRFTANRALGLYQIGNDTDPSPGRSTPVALAGAK